MLTYLKSGEDVKEPVIIEDPHFPITNPLPEDLTLELFSLLSLATSVGLVWLTRKLRKNMEDIRERIKEKETDLLPQEEVGRIKDILAQLAVLTDADRVTLGIFHNGVIGAKGAHYDKVAILAGYCAPGVLPLPEMNKDVKAENLMEDLTPLWNRGDQSLLLQVKNAPNSCRLYMSRRDISVLYNRLLTTGNIEIGVVSFHWCSSYDNGKVPFPPEETRGSRKFQDLIDELLSIVQISKEHKRMLG